MYDDFCQHILGIFYLNAKCDLLTIIWVDVAIHQLFHPFYKIKMYRRNDLLTWKTEFF